MIGYSYEIKNSCLCKQKSQQPQYHSNQLHYRTPTIKRIIPVDEAIRQIEREYMTGQIGIARTGEIKRLSNIYDDRYKDRITYHFPADRDDQRTCPHCNTAHRASERADNRTRCPWCYKIIA